MYQIIGYSIVNGNRQEHKVFKENFVDTIEQIDKFEEKIKKRYEKKTGQSCTVYAVYRRKSR